MRALAVLALCTAAHADPRRTIGVPGPLPSRGGCLGFTPEGTGGVFVMTRRDRAKTTARLLHVAPGNAPNSFLNDAVHEQTVWNRTRVSLDTAVRELGLIACMPIQVGPRGDGVIVRGRSRFVIATAPRTKRVEVSRNGMAGRELATLTNPFGGEERLEGIYVNPWRTVLALHLVGEHDGERDDRFVVVPLE